MWRLAGSSTYIVVHVYAGIVDKCWIYGTAGAAWAGMDTYFREEVNTHNEWDDIDDYNEHSSNQLVVLESSN